MHWVVLFGAFAILWFLALQILLPIGLAPAEENSGDPAVGDPGAPVRPRLGLKLAGATVIAVVVWTIFYALVVTRIIDV
ncbi:MAG TPA: DUF1467 family protein [Rhizomicrobium sp.]|jgi:predicted secreted protein